MAALWDAVRHQQRRLDEQQGEITRLRAELEQGRLEKLGLATQHTDGKQGPDGGGRRISRAGLLTMAAAGAAGLAGAELLGNTGTALANGTMVTGASNNAENATTVQWDGSSNPGVLLLANAFTKYVASQAGFPAALAGWANGTNGMGTGVYGYIEGTPSSAASAVVGWDNTSGAGARGVYGTSINGIGVRGVGGNANPGVQGNGSQLSGVANRGPGVAGVAYGAGTPNMAGGPGVYGSGYGTNLDGVMGEGDIGIGVHGFSSTGVAVQGESGATGMYGIGGSGDGVRGYSTSGVDLNAFGSGRIKQALRSATGPPTSGSFSAGEQIRDSVGNFYICTISGSPGTWKRVATTDLGLQSFSAPYRVFNSTMSYNQVSGATSVTAAGVPAGARSAYCAVQATPSATGPLTLFPAGAADPGIANWTAVQPNVLNLFYMLVPLNSSGQFQIHSYINGPVYVDVWGYLM